MFSAGGAFITGTDSGSAWVRNNDFLGNACSVSGASAQLGLGPIDIDVRNNIIAHGVNGVGIGSSTGTSVASTVEYNDLWANEGGAFSVLVTPTATEGNIVVDPRLVRLSLDRDFDNDDLDLRTDSECIGAGDPRADDTEGRPIDIGARGVTDISDVDLDGDGFSSDGGGDCDDTDPTVHPDAPEQCDDAVDNDCDGLVDEDCEDDTGEASTTTPGDTGVPHDTGDTPEDTAVENTDDDRVSSDSGQNLDPHADLYEIDGQGCKCASTSRRPAWLWFAILPLILIRRRHS